MNDKARILVVDDDGVTRRFVEQALTRQNYAVQVAASGEEAVEALSRDPHFDIIMLDIMMRRGMNGIELLTWIKKNPAIAGCKVMMLTAINQVEAREKAFILGASDFIAKPFDLTELLTRIRAQLELKRAEDILQKYEFMANASESLIALINRDLICEMVNDAYSNALNKPREEIIGKPVAGLWEEPFYRVNIHPHIVACLDGQLQRCEVELRLDGCTTSPYEITFYPYRNRAEEVAYGVLVIVDVSERKMAEKRLQYRLANEELIAQISSRFINIAPEMIDYEIEQTLQILCKALDVDRCYVLLISNNRNTVNFRYEWHREQIAVSLIKNRDIKNLHFRWTLKMCELGEAINIDSVEDLPEEAYFEKRFWLRHNICSLLAVPFKRDLNIVGFLGANSETSERHWNEQDIDLLKMAADVVFFAMEHKRMDTLFQEQQEHFHQIAEIASDYACSVLIDANGNQNLEWQVGSLELLGGFQPHATMPASWLDMVAPAHRALSEAWYHHVIQSSKADSLDFLIATPDKEERWAHIDARPERQTLHQQSVRVVFVLQDITRRKRTEDALTRYTERLQGLRALDQTILAAISPEEIAVATLTRIRSLLAFSGANVMVRDMAQGGMVISAAAVDDHIYNLDQSIVFDESDLPPSVLQGQTLVINDIKADPIGSRIGISLLEKIQICAYAAFPLMVYGQFIGMLNLGVKDVSTITPEYLEIGREVADVLALGIQNARLYAGTTENLKREERLKEITRIISGNLDIDFICDHVIRLSSELVNADLGTIYLLTKDEQAFTTCYYRGHGDHPPEDDPYTIDQQMLGQDIIQSGETCLVNNYPQYAHAQAYYIDQGIGSYMGVLLQSGKRRLGLLNLYRKATNGQFSPRDLALIESVGQHAAVAIQNTLLFQSERHRVHELEAMRETVSDILTELELTKLLEAVVVRAVALLDGDVGELSLYDEKTKRLQILVSFGLDKDYTGTYMALGEEGMGLAALNRQTYIIDNYRKWEALSPQYQNAPPFVMLTVPLLARNKLLGAIAVGDTNLKRRFKDDDSRLINLFGQQAAIAIENALLFDSAQRRATEAETMQRAGAIVSAQLDLADAIKAILNQLALVFVYDSASVQLIKDEELEIVGGSGFDDKTVEGIRFSIHGNNPNQQVVKTCQTQIFNNVRETYPDCFNVPPHDKIVSWMGVPLMIQNRIIGILALDSSQESYFNEEYARLASIFAIHVANAIENARLYQEAQRRATEAETLRQAGAVVASTLDIEEVSARVLEQLSRVVSFDSASIQLVHENVVEVVGGLPYPGFTLPKGKIFAAMPEDLSGKVIHERRALIIQDAKIEYPNAFLPPYDYINSWLGIPLVAKNRVIGLVTLDSHDRRHFTAEHARLAQAFVDQVAIAVENARLYEETQRLAITDGLTDLFTRRHFFQLAHKEFERAVRYRRHLAIIMLDIDHFKVINDTHGHVIGDQVLQAVAGRCRVALREIDLIGRYGGEEFIILLPETRLEAAFEVAERLRQQVSQHITETRTGTVSVTVSMGVVELDHSETIELEKLLDRADQALYIAKNSGRNQIKAWNKQVFGND